MRGAAALHRSLAGMGTRARGLTLKQPPHSRKEPGLRPTHITGVVPGCGWDLGALSGTSPALSPLLPARGRPQLLGGATT